MQLRTLIAALAVVLALGCSKKGPYGKVSVSAGSNRAAAAPGPTIHSIDLGHGLSLGRVRVVVASIKLEAAESESPDSDSGTMAVRRSDSMGGGDGGDDGEEAEVRVGPFLVDVGGDQLIGPVTQVFDGEVPAGTYHEVRLEICPVTADQAGMDAGLAAMAGLGASIALDGTAMAGATPWELTFPACARIKHETTVVIADGGSSTNLTLTLDPASWFAGPSGTTLDPTSDADRPAILANILSSLDVFRDDDDDGMDDDHEGDGGGHG